MKLPLILFSTASEFWQQNVIPGAAQEGVGAFAEPSRYRIVMPMDEPSDLLYRLTVHELTHQFQYDIIPTSLVRQNMPLWVFEGMSDYMTGIWRPIDLMTVRDAAVADIVPKMSELQGYGSFGNARLIYNLGHAAFEFIEARWGKEGVRQARPPVLVVADHHQERPRLQRDEGLAAERMALDHRQLQREFVGCAAHRRDQHAGVRAGRVGHCQRMVTLGPAAIDGEMIVAADLDDLPEVGEVFAGERLGFEDSVHRGSFMWRLTSL